MSWAALNHTVGAPAGPPSRLLPALLPARAGWLNITHPHRENTPAATHPPANLTSLLSDSSDDILPRRISSFSSPILVPSRGLVLAHSFALFRPFGTNLKFRPPIPFLHTPTPLTRLFARLSSDGRSTGSRSARPKHQNELEGREEHIKSHWPLALVAAESEEVPGRGCQGFITV